MIQQHLGIKEEKKKYIINKIKNENYLDKSLP